MHYDCTKFAIFKNKMNEMIMFLESPAEMCSSVHRVCSAWTIRIHNSADFICFNSFVQRNLVLLWSSLRQSRYKRIALFLICIMWPCSFLSSVSQWFFKSETAVISMNILPNCCTCICIRLGGIIWIRIMYSYSVTLVICTKKPLCYNLDREHIQYSD